MGGAGSGRGYQGGRATTGQMLALDVRRVQRDGLLIPGRASTWTWARNGEKVASIQMRTEADRVILDYSSRSNGGEWQAIEYPVSLEWTGCTLGGRRVWFLCPGKECGRRVAILFGGSIFACRQCHKLVYACQREDANYRALRRSDRIRDRLGWPAGIANPDGGKPKGMHWRTFERLTAEHDAFVQVSLAATVRRFGLRM